MTIHRFDVNGLELVLFDVPALEIPDDVELSASEREVVAFVCEGLSTGEIAKQRGTSTKTISNQLGSIYRKLGVLSRHELVAKLASSTRADLES